MSDTIRRLKEYAELAGSDMMAVVDTDALHEAALLPMHTIQRLAALADAVGRQAGVGGCETAGALVSYLAAHPEKIARLFTDGVIDLVGDDDMWGDGALTFHRKLDSKVVTPQDLRIARQVRDLSKPTP